MAICKIIDGDITTSITFTSNFEGDRPLLSPAPHVSLRPCSTHAKHRRDSNKEQQHLFNGIFSRTTWISWHRTGRPFWISTKQETMGWHWRQLDHMQMICTSLQTDNHASTSSLKFLQASCSSWRPTNSDKALHATGRWLWTLLNKNAAIYWQPSAECKPEPTVNCKKCPRLCISLWTTVTQNTAQKFW